MTSRYAIIGGGIAGASVAYHLSQRTDDPIVLFDRQSPASETTFKSVAQYGFYGDETQYRMKRYGMQLYNEFFQEPTANPAYRFMGILVAATEEENAAELQQAVEAGGDPTIGKPGLGFDRDLVEYIHGDELEETLLLPPVNTDAIAGALFRPKVGYMNRPQELAHEFLARAKANGVTVRANTAVTAIETHSDRVTGLTTEDGQTVAADNIVCAAGPWNIDISQDAGIDLPVKHTLAPILKLTPTNEPDYTMPVVNHYESPYAFHRRDADEFLVGYNPGGYEKGTKYDPATVSDSVPTSIRDEGIELLEQLVPGILNAEMTDQWVGVRSVTPDGNPVVGWTDLEGFSIAAFHTSGIQLAPAVGDMIATQLVDDEPTEYYDALSITRFDGYTDHRT